MLIQVILAESNEQLLEDYRTASPAADLVELRLDRVPDLNLAAIFTATGKPRVATCRSRSQGGFFAGSEEQRQRILRESILHGAEYVDLEFETDDEKLLGLTGSTRPIRVIRPAPSGSPDQSGSVRWLRVRCTRARILRIFSASP